MLFDEHEFSMLAWQTRTRLLSLFFKSAIIVSLKILVELEMAIASKTVLD
jgi:hypothetical protein